MNKIVTTPIKLSDLVLDDLDITNSQDLQYGIKKMRTYRRQIKLHARRRQALKRAIRSENFAT